MLKPLTGERLKKKINKNLFFFYFFLIQREVYYKFLGERRRVMPLSIELRYMTDKRHMPAEGALEEEKKSPE